MSMVLYTNQESRGVVVDWLLKELNIEIEHQYIEFGAEMKSPNFLKLNPFGKVPVLVDGETVIYELSAICTYLADRYPEKGLAPALNDPKRGLYYRWLFFTAGPFTAACDNAFLGVNVEPEQKMFMDYGDYHDTYQALIAGLEQANPYLCGEQFTAADVLLGATLLWLFKMNKIEEHPALIRYLTVLRQRDGLKKSGLIAA